MQNDLISRSALKSFLCKCCNILHSEDPCEPGECNVMGWVSELPTVDAVPVEKLGKFGKLFLPYKGCPRGRVGRMGDGHLEEEALFWGTIEDVDGGRWVPVVEAVLLELIEKAKSAVDAVAVVRCRDCKHWHSETGWCNHHSHFITDDGEACHPWESANWKTFEENDFCSYGERRGDDGK